MKNVFAVTFLFFISYFTIALASDSSPSSPYIPGRSDFRPDLPQASSTPPQVAPNIALAPNAEDRAQINQLFDPKKAKYKALRKYSIVKLFPIPMLADKNDSR